ncbi:hypothetical protein SLEP1_g23137 [Rubroshorea leprosula]|uniref:Protein kinase domain-containing protein n=1 Tax=Rubroshorea leprosula TaxID=152421 RepID=A0AAV5JHJ5_9ROSI|nr:hypothetical protein SLEP1_g23137 [Rubroshorea leprosula]
MSPSTAKSSVSHVQQISNAVGSPFQQDGSDLHSPPALPPFLSVPVPEIAEGHIHSMTPSSSVGSPVYNTAPPPSIEEGHVPSTFPIPPILSPPLLTASPPLLVQGHAPSISPSAPQMKEPISRSPVSGHTPSISPSPPHMKESVGKPPVSGYTPSISPSPPQMKEPVSKSPVSVSDAPAPIASPLRNLPKNSPAINTTTVPKPSHKSPQSLPAISQSPISTPLRDSPLNPPAKHSNRTSAFQPSNQTNDMAPVLQPTAPAPISVPLRNSSLNIPATPSSMPRALAPTSSQRNLSNNEAPTLPTAPVPVAVPLANSPHKLPRIPSSSPSGSQRNATNIASPPRKLESSPPTAHPMVPGNPPSILPDIGVSPAPTPPQSNNRGNHGTPLASPGAETHKPLPPVEHSPKKDTAVSPAPTPPQSFNRGNHGTPVASPGAETHKPLPPTEHSPKKDIGVSPAPTPPQSINRGNHGTPVASPGAETHKPLPPAEHSPKKDIGVSSAPTPPQSINRKNHGTPVTSPGAETHKPLPPVEQSPKKDISVSPAPTPTQSINRKNHGNPVTSPGAETPKPLPPVEHSPKKDISVSPAPTPPQSINWENHGTPVASPGGETHKPLPPANHSPKNGSSAAVSPMHKSVRPPYKAPTPSVSSPKPSPNEGHFPSALSPSPSFEKHQHPRNKITSSAPTSSYLISPPSEQQGPVISPDFPRKRQRHYATPPLNPGSSFPPPHAPSSMSHLSSAPSPSPMTVSSQMPIPHLSPVVSPPASQSPKEPVLPPVQFFPPPPPNKDCSGIACTEPLTNTVPGSPCGCVLPMQVGLSLSVALYTFFPLVSELAVEIAVGVFMKQSQVRVMGANAASEQPEKTVVLLDLVPLGQKFDNTTAFLTYQKFWHKQVAINPSFFGDYEVLYVRYPGLPASPPLPPSSIGMINNDPYSSNDNNTMKPLGVDVQKKQNKNGLSGGMIAIIILSASVAVVLCLAFAWVLLFKRRNNFGQQAPTPQPLPSFAKPSGSAGSMVGSGLSSASPSFASSIATYTGSAKTFSASDIEKATDNFDSSKVLGEGGFGRVHSGVLEDGTKVAVKVLKRDDQQGGREFLAEVEMLSRLHHRNLVKLIGICTEERIRCLVYELIPNGSVDSHLHGVDKESAPLDWDARIKIALGAARGLAYLHEDSSPRVIHRDFKASNILLENDFTPKVSDFGLARTALDEENRHISTRVMGTFGYVAPEYAMTGHLLVKSDVYSYGVVLLELLTGRKPIDMSQPPGQENLVAWARPLLSSKDGLETIIDPCLGSNVPFDSVAKVAAIASMCVQPEVSHRPFMGEVVQALKLVCNECDEAKDVGSRTSSRDDLSTDLEARVSTGSGQLTDPLQNHHSAPKYESALETERALTISQSFSASARFGGQSSESFRRHSSSGPLGTGRGKRFWQSMEKSSRGSVSEHGFIFRFWPGSH